MMAYDDPSYEYDNIPYGTLYGTSDEWGLIQNALKISGLPFEGPPDGWHCHFHVNGNVCEGKGWEIPTVTRDWVVEYLKSRGYGIYPLD